MQLHRLGRKKAYFFSLDAVLAVIILLTGIFLVFYIMTNKPVETPTYQLSQDIINILSKTKLSNLTLASTSKIQLLINAGTITNKDNTILEQLGEMYSSNPTDCQKANNLCWKNMNNIIAEIITNFIPNQNGISLYLHDSTTAVPVSLQLYSRNPTPLVALSSAKIVISSKKIIFGKTNTNQLWGPYVIEARAWR